VAVPLVASPVVASAQTTNVTMIRDFHIRSPPCLVSHCVVSVDRRTGESLENSWSSLLVADPGC
jgi:hypothetical protein